MTQDSSQCLVKKNIHHYTPPCHIVNSKCDGHRNIYEKLCKIMRARDALKPVSKRYTVAHTHNFSCKQTEGGKLCIFLCFPGDIENQPLLYNRKHKKQWRKLRWRSDSCSAVELNRPIRCIISSASKWLFIDEDCFIPKLGKWWKVL